MRLILIFITFIVSLGFSSNLFAANCGGLNQVPCTIFQRDIIKYGSCDRNLKEDFIQKRCISNAAKPAPVIAPQPRPGNCGRQNQPPCGPSIHYTPCEHPTQLYLRNGRCMSQQSIQAEENRIRQQPVNCGALGQRPCSIVEKIPSCNGLLVEDFIKGQCVKPLPPPKATQDVINEMQRMVKNTSGDLRWLADTVNQHMQALARNPNLRQQAIAAANNNRPAEAARIMQVQGLVNKLKRAHGKALQDNPHLDFALHEGPYKTQTIAHNTLTQTNDYTIQLTDASVAPVSNPLVFKTISIQLASFDASFGIGGGGDSGIMIQQTYPISCLYYGGSWSLGTSVGADGGAGVGLWFEQQLPHPKDTVHKDAYSNAHGLVLAGGAGAGASSTFWWDIYSGKFQGIQLTFSLGASVEVEYTRGATKIYGCGIGS